MSTSSQRPPGATRSLPKRTTTGLGVLVALTLLGGFSSGLFGAAVFFGLTIFGTGLWHAAVGRSWLSPLLPQGRRVGVFSLVIGLVAMIVGTAIAPQVDERDLTPVASASPSPSPSPPPSTSSPPASPSPTTSTTDTDGAVVAALAQLDVKGRAPKTGYSREAFGQKWADVDRNGCDTRNDILRRDLEEARTTPGSHGCTVMTGTLQDPYTGNAMGFVRGTGTSGEIHIDHVVALSDAWQKGAQQWDQEQRTGFANDPLNLLAVQGVANQQKGDGDTATWLPANKSFRCNYVARQVAVKAQYELSVTQAEHDAMEDILFECPDPRLPSSVDPPPTTDSIDATPAPAIMEPTAPEPATTPAVRPTDKTTPSATTPEPTPAAPEPVVSDPVPADVYYKNCTAAREASAAPLLVGEPGYRPAMDGDNDGVACE